MNNKLFCTFTSQDDLERTLVEVKSSYDILYRKIFVLYIKSNDEYVCTYNVEPSSVESILPNTILVHRKKSSNENLFIQRHWFTTTFSREFMALTFEYLVEFQRFVKMSLVYLSVNFSSSLSL